MGLLDDAIREHLELKRRSGGDPAEIAHQEHAALEPVFPAEHRAEEPHAPVADEPVEEASHESEPVLAPIAAEPEASDPIAHVNQETAEIDMDEILAQDAVAGSTEAAEEDGFEWEDPGEEREPLPEQVPGQERMSFE